MTKIPDNANKVFEGITFDVYQWPQPLYDGSVTTFEMIRRNDTVVVIPVVEDQIYYIEQEQPVEGKINCFPGGMIEKDEIVELAAKRELLEETGFLPEELIVWKEFQLASRIEWSVHIFIAKNCKIVSEIHPDAGEKIIVRHIDFDSMMNMIINEEIRTGPETITEFLHAKYDKEKYKELKDMIMGKK